MAVLDYPIGRYRIGEMLVLTRTYSFTDSNRVAMRVDRVLFYLLGDHLGSTSLTTHANGQVHSEMKYKPYGEMRLVNGQSPTDIGYVCLGWSSTFDGYSTNTVASSNGYFVGGGTGLDASVDVAQFSLSVIHGNSEGEQWFPGVQRILMVGVTDLDKEKRCYEKILYNPYTIAVYFLRWVPDNTTCA